MLAVGAVRAGGPEVLQLVDVPTPVPGPGEVLIRVAAAAVNPTDMLIRSGAALVHDRQPSQAPWVPGMDLAGTIAALGRGAPDRLAVDDRVVALVLPRGTHGAYSQFVAVPAASVVAAPRGQSLPAASTLLMNAMTARRALDLLELAAGESVAVTGAAGTLGGYVLQLGALDGMRMIADAADADVDLVRALGADEVVRRGDDFGSQVVSVVPGGVAAVVDCAVLNELAVSALRPGGRLATVRDWTGPSRGGIDVRRVRVREVVEDTVGLGRLVRLVDEGRLALRVARTFPARQAPDAHRLLERGGVRGRIVLDFEGLEAVRRPARLLENIVSIDRPVKPS